MANTEREPSAEALAVLSRELEGVRASLRLRSVIEQAKGVLVARHRITPDQAFERLRELSQQHNVRLAEVAATLVGVSLPEFSAPAPSNSPPAPGLAVTGATSPEWRAFRETAEVRMRTSAAVFQSLSSAAREGSEAARLIRVLGKPLGLGGVLIYRLLPDGSLQALGSDGYPGDLVSAWRGIPPGLDVPLHRAVREGRPVYLEDRAARDRAFPAVAHVTPQFQATATLPVVDPKRTLGAIGLGWRDPQEFTADVRIQVEHLIGSVGPVLLRSVTPADPVLEWVSALLELLFDPWILLDAIREADGRVVDFAVVRTGAQVGESAPAERRRLFEIAPGLAEPAVFASLARVARFGGVWEAVLTGHELGALPHAGTATRVRMFAVGEQYVLHWRAEV